jgi:FtsP/CotA-like multicopper oxidase with cupredoxin domain
MKQTVCLVAVLLLGTQTVAQSTIDYTVTAEVASWTLHTGRVVTAWTYDGTLPGPALHATEGDTLRVRFTNHLPEGTTIHWHGLPNTIVQDGVPEVCPIVVEPGQEHTYLLESLPAGTYWFHPHVGVQIDQGLYGTLIVDPLVPDPVAQRDYSIVLDDWRDGAPIIVPAPSYTEYLINGHTSQGQSALMVTQGETVRLRFFNASAATNYVVAVDQHPMTVIRTDGQRVVPITKQAIQLGMGERYDVLLTANNPGVWSIAASSITNRNATMVRAVLAYTGSSNPWPTATYVPPFLATGTLLSYSQMAAAGPVAPISAAPDRVHAMQLSSGTVGGQPAFFINGEAFPNVTPLDVALGENVRFNMVNMTMMVHPMHIHGHFLRLLGTAGGTTAPLVKDTVLVPGMMGQIDAEIVADNPGNWVYHCHHIYHAALGMMTLVRYVGSDSDGDGLGDDVDHDPLGDHPVLALDSLGNGFAIGTSYDVSVQWPAGEHVAFVIGTLLNPPRPFGPAGDLYVGQRTLLGRAIAGANGIATLNATIPNDPLLVGQRLVIQAMATHATLAGGRRLSRHEILTPQ